MKKMVNQFCLLILANNAFMYLRLLAPPQGQPLHPPEVLWPFIYESTLEMFRLYQVVDARDQLAFLLCYLWSVAVIVICAWRNAWFGLRVLSRTKIFALALVSLYACSPIQPGYSLIFRAFYSVISNLAPVADQSLAVLALTQALHIHLFVSLVLIALLARTLTKTLPSEGRQS